MATAHDEDRVRETVNTITRGWWVAVLIAVILGGLAYGYDAGKPRIYQANETLYALASASPNQQLAYQSTLATQQQMTSYVGLATSDVVLARAIKEGNLSLTMDQMRSNVHASAAIGTVLLQLSATARTADEAVEIVQAVGAAAVHYIAGLNVTTQRQPDGSVTKTGQVGLTIISPARAESSPVSPHIVRDALAAGVLGLALGVALVIVFARFSRKIKRESDLARLTDLPVLARIPYDAQLHDEGVLHLDADYSSGAEAFRKLRAGLAFVNVDSPPRRILVTSAAPGEGKTRTAARLAATWARSGVKVLAVDADLRRPQLANCFPGMINRVGLTDWLRDGFDVSELIQQVDDEGLSLLSSGALPPNPAELLSTRRAQIGFERFTRTADVVIVDSPPILPVADSLVLSRHVDAIVMTVRVGKTSSDQLRQALIQLEQAHARVVGLVLVGVKHEEAGYGYGYAPIEAESAKPTKKRKKRRA